jgi:2',3'-cyclic-nucleotide 2'-phosphodiesterase (5'-nucleotidase family)
VSRRLVLSLVGFLLVSVHVSATELTLLYTNDLHVRLDRLGALERLIDEERSRTDALLLLDAGDTWQDFRTPLAAVWGADEMVAWMNRVGYDAMALGNHDFYWGKDRLSELVEKANFAVLCGNMRSIDGTPPPFAASTRVRAGSLEILVLGLTTTDYFPYIDYPWLRPVDAAQSLREEMAKWTEPVDLVICVAHVPVDVGRRLAALVQGIDVFVTGHSHEETPIPVRSGATWIVQSGAFGRSLGRLVLEIDSPFAPPRLVSHALLPTEKAPIPTDRGQLQLVYVLFVLCLGIVLTLL